MAKPVSKGGAAYTLSKRPQEAGNGSLFRQIAMSLVGPVKASFEVRKKAIRGVDRPMVSRVDAWLEASQRSNQHQSQQKLGRRNEREAWH